MAMDELVESWNSGKLLQDDEVLPLYRADEDGDEDDDDDDFRFNMDLFKLRRDASIHRVENGRTFG
jgi:hypothetical protein